MKAITIEERTINFTEHATHTAVQMHVVVQKTTFILRKIHKSSRCNRGCFLAQSYTPNRLSARALLHWGLTTIHKPHSRFRDVALEKERKRVEGCDRKSERNEREIT